MAKLYLVGIGPGSKEDMTVRAIEALRKSDIICGFGRYTDIIRKEFAGDPVISSKTFYTTGMTREKERCRYALDRAVEGITTSLICSGDSGIYGMASPVLELAGEYRKVEIEIIPGVTAASSGAAITGAPLGHDFAVISLSDRLTPWEIIAKRLRLIAAADMPMAIYNPRSKGRADYLARASKILMEEGIPADRPCALAMHTGRDEERAVICTLGDLENADADMQTTVFIGSSATYTDNGRIITPRGYAIRE